MREREDEGDGDTEQRDDETREQACTVMWNKDRIRETNKERLSSSDGIVRNKEIMLWSRGQYRTRTK